MYEGFAREGTFAVKPMTRLTASKAVKPNPCHVLRTATGSPIGQNPFTHKRKGFFNALSTLDSTLYTKKSKKMRNFGPPAKRVPAEFTFAERCKHQL